MATARQPRSVPAHLVPKFSNICVENSGNAAATLERRMMFAATVEAALESVGTESVALWIADSLQW